MTGPDYILIGAMKCGTTTLAGQLGAQDGLFMTDPKEPNYFSDDAVFAKGPEWYASLFESAQAGDLKGEASTHYTKRPELPETVGRMQAALPKVRLVYMIRDPMVRLVSHYIHAWSEGEVSKPLESVLAEDPGALVNYGLYGWQIAPFVKSYGAGAICLTSLERLKADPESELARIAAHIGYEGIVTWFDEAAAENISATRVRKLPFHELLVDHPLATTLRRTFVPKVLRNRIRAARQMHDRPAIPSKARTALEARFAEDRTLLEEAFPGDPSLALAYPWLR